MIRTIIVEGPDGAGKTTLCRWICDTFDLKMGERGTRNRDELFKCTREDTWRAMATELRCDEPPLVWDRLGPYSDPIYAPLGVPPRKQAFTQSETLMFQDFVERMGMLIVCLPPFEAVKANVTKEHQMEGVNENIRKIYLKYSKLRVFAFVYDYTSPRSLISVGVLINRYLLARKERECLSFSTHAVSASDPAQTEASH